MNLAGLYSQIEAKKRRIYINNLWKVPKRDPAGSATTRKSSIATAYPIDFRTESVVQSQALTPSDVKAPGQEASEEMMKKAMKISGETDSWVFSGHPTTIKKMKDREVRR